MQGTKYRLGERIGAGGMAEVFRAEKMGAQGFERTVAIKRMLPRWATDRRCTDMFASEARLLAALHHRNFASVSDFARDAQGCLFLAMELLEGVDLSSLVRTGPVPFPVAIYIVGEILGGLGYLHGLVRPDRAPQGFVHRDLSTSNVHLSWAGAVKITDFGLAKACADSHARASGARAKPRYRSPEQARGRLIGHMIDQRTDLFAVGVILYELITGTMPGVGSTWGMISAALLRRRIEPPSAMRPETPADLEAITMHLLERNRERRPESAEVVLEALDRCQAASHPGRAALGELLRERVPAAAARVDSPPDPLRIAEWMSGWNEAMVLQTVERAPQEPMLQTPAAPAPAPPPLETQQPDPPEAARLYTATATSRQDRARWGARWAWGAVLLLILGCGMGALVLRREPSPASRPGDTRATTPVDGTSAAPSEGDTRTLPAIPASQNTSAPEITVELPAVPPVARPEIETSQLPTRTGRGLAPRPPRCTDDFPLDFYAKECP